uniref:Oxysterol-binding protein n=1 Tax=Myripristis murdjan TaxID=586833 RepID=A0A667XC89_9TELE
FSLLQSESRMFNGVEKDCPSPTEKLARKESLKLQKQNYRQEKKRAAKELFSALKDPSVVIMSNWLKIRGSLKSWTKLWCALKPGVLLIYKTPKTDHWVGTVLLNACKLIERPSKKDGFCFKLYHPLDKSIWAVKGPKGENVGSITQPLPSNYLIFRAASESDGRCWMDALELALSCSSLYKLTAKAGREGDIIIQAHTKTPQLIRHKFIAMLLLYNHSHQTVKAPHDHTPSCSSPKRLMGDKCHCCCLPFVSCQSVENFGTAGESSQVETVSEENKGLIWTLLKQLRPGMDLSKVVLPTFILEPRSFLDKLSDYYYHADLLSQAALEESAYGRIKQVLRWYLSGFYKKPKGLKKPYNPILGETFRCCWLHPQTDSCTFYIAEQVSHHPPISAFYVCNKKDGFSISGSILAKSKFYGNSLSAILDGKARLLFLSRDEEYVITMPYAHCKGILYGTMTLELGGKISIECEKTKCAAELEFKLKVYIFLSKLHEVFIHEKRSGQQETLWNPSPEVRNHRLKRQVVQLDQQGEFESERLWRHVTSAIMDRDQNRATQEKFVLEDAQRKEARERGDKPWCPRLFHQDPVTSDWTYKHIDLRPWDPECCLVQFEKDGVIQTHERSQRRHNGLSYSHSWASQQKVSQHTHTHTHIHTPAHLLRITTHMSPRTVLLGGKKTFKFKSQCYQLSFFFYHICVLLMFCQNKIHFTFLKSLLARCIRQPPPNQFSVSWETAPEFCVSSVFSQSEVNGKRRKASSQPSSCSQNTESSSTTPEPTHESSDNEGKTHTHTQTHTHTHTHTHTQNTHS